MNDPWFKQYDFERTKNESHHQKMMARSAVVKFILVLVLLAIPVMAVPLSYGFITLFPQLAGTRSTPPSVSQKVSNPDVLAETDATDSARIQFNLDTVFNDNVYVDGELLVKGRTIFSGAVEAPNIIYEVIAGEGLELTGDQNITLVNTGVVSIQGQTGTVEFIEGTGIDIDGLTISNTGVTSFQGSTGCSHTSGRIGNIDQRQYHWLE